LTGTQTGGSAIISYVILWDGPASNPNFGTATLSPILGDSTPNLLTSIVLPTGITSGNRYQFQFQGRNAHGDGTASAIISVLAATAPNQMNAPAVSAVSASVSLKYRVTVVAPYSGGSGIAIDAYDIYIKHKTGGGYSSITSECDGS
jgi:hypothetical protein